nr:immunoglobulin heavy chain junction region [Mus musculus]NSM07203.1 immunoglobulin heavy chain junction region [Mus musculus]
CARCMPAQATLYFDYW